MKKLSLFFALMLLFLTAAVNNVSADYQPNHSTEQINQQYEKPYNLTSFRSNCNHCDTDINQLFLDRTLKHEELVDGDIDRFFKLVDQLINLGQWLIGGSVLALFIAFFILLWRISKAVTATVNERLANMDLSPLVKSAANKIISNRLGLKNKIAIFEPENSSVKQTKVFSYLSQSGFTNLKISNHFSSALKNDLVIFIFQPEFEDSLNKLLSFLSETNSSTPVLIYAEKVRVNNEILAKYDFVSLANNLLTLASWTLTISSNTTSKKGN